VIGDEIALLKMIAATIHTARAQMPASLTYVDRASISVNTPAASNVVATAPAIV
jgi:hypothetical protein